MPFPESSRAFVLKEIRYYPNGQIKYEIYGINDIIKKYDENGNSIPHKYKGVLRNKLGELVN